MEGSPPSNHWFRSVVSSLAPSETELANARRTRDFLLDRVGRFLPRPSGMWVEPDEIFVFNRAVLGGSYGSGTHIEGFDFDVLFILHGRFPGHLFALRESDGLFAVCNVSDGSCVVYYMLHVGC